MATIIKPPQSLAYQPNKRSVFLAGSIEMGKAKDWQAYVGNNLLNFDIIIWNPRRTSWDSSWEQSINNPVFKEQVDWELDALDRAELILFHFESDTQSPITLMELGLFAQSKKCLVHCPEGFWRKGNVDIVCDRYNIQQVNSLDHGIAKLKDHFNSCIVKRHNN
ncbi:nucleoside 2-deoxyribosyltransferase domain-containing protein [Aureispira anguillae]|nr:nucleoside 2-deoxyribosyltransferase domain-containing protein [Aureispira anguillae]